MELDRRFAPGIARIAGLQQLLEQANVKKDPRLQLPLYSGSPTRTAGAGGGGAAFSAWGRGQVFADCNRKGEGCRAGALCRDNTSVALLSFSKRLSPPAKGSARVYADFSAVARAARGFGAQASQVRTRVRA